jgi:hypothetical protein
MYYKVQNSHSRVRIDPMHTMSPSAHNSNQRPKAEVVKGTTQWWKAVGAGLPDLAEFIT